MRKFLALHRNVRVRLGLSFVLKLNDAMILTFIAIYLADAVGIATAGALILLFAVFAVFGMLLGGDLSERWGRRPVLIVGEVIALVFLGLMSTAFFAGWGALAVYFSYGIVKFGTNLALPANDSTIIDVTPAEDRKFVYTLNYWVINLALGIGALAGGFLYGSHFGKVILGGTVAMAFVLVLTILLIDETRPAAADAGPPGLTGWGRMAAGYRVVLADSTFRRLVIAATLMLTLEWQLTTSIGIRLADDFPTQAVFPFGAVTGVEMLGVLKAVNTLLVVTLALFVNALLRRMPDRQRLYSGVTLYATGFAVLAVTNDAWLLITACVVLTIGELMDIPVRQALLAEFAPEDGRPRYMAAYYLHIRVSQVINSVLISVSAVLSTQGMAGIYLVLGVLIIMQYRVILARRAPRAATDTRVSTG